MTIFLVLDLVVVLAGGPSYLAVPVPVVLPVGVVLPFSALFWFGSGYMLRQSTEAWGIARIFA